MMRYRVGSFGGGAESFEAVRTGEDSAGGGKSAFVIVTRCFHGPG